MVYDLAQPYFTGMPHHPTHPPFLTLRPLAINPGPDGTFSGFLR